jgi:membrane protein
MPERDDRGRQAESPGQIPAKGWIEIAKRVKAEAKTDNISLLASGVAFRAFLAFPATLVALVSVWALVADPATLERQIGDALEAAPAEVRDFFVQQLSSLADASEGALTVGAIIGVLAALWSASTAMGYMVTAINLAYDEEETRGFVQRKGLALGLTLGAVLFTLVMLGLIAAVPALLDNTALGDAAKTAINVLRWPIMLAGFMVALSFLYRQGPDRDSPRWTWVSWGAVIAGVVWLAASVGFSLYTRFFGNYNATYGSIGGIVILLLWLLITITVVLYGAELNSEIEHQTAKDTTKGEPRPLGERGAFVADTTPDEKQEEPVRR